MEKLIAGLFDYQKFEGNPKLADVISKVRASISTARPLEDSEVDVWAAGEPLPDVPPTEKRYD